MVNFCVRYFVICCLVVAVLAPKLSAAIFDAMPSVQTRIICTGTELIVLRIGADGQPVEAPELVSDYCTIINAITAAESRTPHWQKLAQDFQFRFSVKLHVAANLETVARNIHSRAPPELI